MKMKKGKALLATLTAAFAFSTIAAAASFSVKASAEVKVEYDAITLNGTTVSEQTLGEQTVRFGMETGASVRVSTSEDTTGMRFATYVYTDDYNAVITEGGSFGMLIMPKDKLGTNELTHAVGVAGEDYLDIEAEKVRTDDTGLTQFNGVITALKATNYAREFCARGYAELDGSYVYTDFDMEDHSRSAKNVAMDAVANGKVTEKNQEQLQTYFGKTVADVQKVQIDDGRKFGYIVSEGRTHLPVAYKEYNVFNGWVNENGEAVSEIAAGTTVTSLTATWKSVMPDGVLDNFDDKVSSIKRYTVGSETAGGEVGSDKVTWLESYTTNEETRYGVLRVHINNGEYFWANFTRTAEELKDIGVEQITFKVAISNGTGTADNMLRWNKYGETNTPFGTGTVSGNAIPWQEVTIDVETLATFAHFNTGVWDTVGNGAAGNWLIRSAAESWLYIDEITYYAPEKETPMPEGVLEDFSSESYSLQRNCVGTGAYLVAPSLAGQTEWLESHTAGEETKNGVLHVTLNYAQYWTTQFSRTAEELAALGVESISLKMAWTATSETAGNSLRFSDDKTATGDTGTYAGSNVLNSDGWQTVTISLADLNAFKRFDGNAFASFGSDGGKNWLIRCAYASTTVQLYVDEITYTAGEKPMPDGVFENFSHENSETRFVIKNASGTATSTQPVWEESYTDENSVTKEGVLKVSFNGASTSANQFLYANFTRTEAALDALIASGVKKITFVIAFEKPSSASDTGLRWSDNANGDKNWTFGTASTAKQWHEWTIDLTQLQYHTRFSSDGTTSGSIDIGSLGSDVAGNILIRAPYAITVYIDEIKYS